mmetsp:Transcript_66352/g.143171  ORF Transcript_66352/g.143171 Transcript_66352/m.143171 type:complete len:244 (-) Transcript_66352:160-891(-)
MGNAGKRGGARDRSAARRRQRRGGGGAEARDRQQERRLLVARLAGVSGLRGRRRRFAGRRATGLGGPPAERRSHAPPAAAVVWGRQRQPHARSLWLLRQRPDLALGELHLALDGLHRRRGLRAPAAGGGEPEQAAARAGSRHADGRGQVRSPQARAQQDREDREPLAAPSAAARRQLGEGGSRLARARPELGRREVPRGRVALHVAVEPDPESPHAQPLRPVRRGEQDSARLGGRHRGRGFGR